MSDYSRSERVGAEMRRELAYLLRDSVKDKRLSEVTIQEVRVTRDLSHAKVYFTLLNKDDAKLFEQILARAAGFLRRKLGQVMKLRTVPELHFLYDSSIEDGQRLSALIEKAVADSSAEESNG